MTALTHERCSELLRPYVEGQLDAAGTADVAAHLESCPGCALEHAALLAMSRPVEPLSEEELRSLRAAVKESTRQVDEVGRAREGRRERRPWARLAPALGAAAVVVLLGIWVASGPFGVVTGSSGDAGSTAGGASSEQSTDEALRPGKEGASADPVWLKTRPDLTPTELKRRGRLGLPFQRFANAYVAEDASSAREPLLDALVVKAPAELESQIRECAGIIFAGEDTALPAFGTRATLDGREALVLGFTWSDEGGALDRFMVWAWGAGACDEVRAYQSGPIKSRP